MILQISDTGAILNQNPHVRLGLQVQPDNAPPYEATVATFISRVSVPRIGDAIVVKYNFKKPQTVILP